MAKKTKDEIKTFFEEQGKTEFNIKVSNQAANILKYLEWTTEEWNDFAEEINCVASNRQNYFNEIFDKHFNND